jgi:hypothetical protein
MAQMIYVRPRLTHGYVGTYRHLDKWGDEVQAKQLAARKIPAWTRLAMSAGVRHGRNADHVNVDMSDGPTYVSRVIAPRNLQDRKAFIRALEDEFSSWGCAHSHDCCGCASYSATARHARGREYVLKIQVSYNY